MQIAKHSTNQAEKRRRLSSHAIHVYDTERFRHLQECWSHALAIVIRLHMQLMYVVLPALLGIFISNAEMRGVEIAHWLPTPL